MPQEKFRSLFFHLFIAGMGAACVLAGLSLILSASAHEKAKWYANASSLYIQKIRIEKDIPKRAKLCFAARHAAAKAIQQNAYDAGYWRELSSVSALCAEEQEAQEASFLARDLSQSGPQSAEVFIEEYP